MGWGGIFAVLATVVDWRVMRRRGRKNRIAQRGVVEGVVGRDV